ncbi:MAG: AMP-binding protein, partial [Flavobacteriales bacterium]|nr:AMP-binding protein [Flavobacteriales bacterium]
RSLSYGELNAAVNQLADYILQEHGVGLGDLVSIQLHDRIEMLIGMLAVMKSGGCYVPIDSRYPADRIAYMISDSQSKLVIDGDLLEAYNSKEEVEYSKENPKLIGEAGDLAYCIYTSGSTGQPKGVLVERGALLNLCYWHNSTFKITKDDRSSQYLGVAFDASVSEIFPYLMAGASLYVIPEEIRLDVRSYLDTTMNMA